MDVIPDGEGVEEHRYDGIVCVGKLGSVPQETTQPLCQQRQQNNREGELRVFTPGVCRQEEWELRNRSVTELHE